MSKRYRGKGATGYEARRQGKRKWILENEGTAFLLPDGIKTVLDVPIGTGRFHEIYEERGLIVTGVDTSPDMLKEAKKKGFSDLHLGDIRNMNFPSKCFDVSVCIRLFAWFEPDAVLAAMKEMARVSDTLIINIRTNENESFCKNESLWNHYRPDFKEWVNQIGYEIDAVFPIGDNGNDIYRLVICE